MLAAGDLNLDLIPIPSRVRQVQGIQALCNGFYPQTRLAGSAAGTTERVGPTLRKRQSERHRSRRYRFVDRCRPKSQTPSSLRNTGTVVAIAHAGERSAGAAHPGTIQTGVPQTPACNGVYAAARSRSLVHLRTGRRVPDVPLRTSSASAVRRFQQLFEPWAAVGAVGEESAVRCPFGSIDDVQDLPRCPCEVDAVGVRVGDVGRRRKAAVERALVCTAPLVVGPA